MRSCFIKKLTHTGYVKHSWSEIVDGQAIQSFYFDLNSTKCNFNANGFMDANMIEFYINFQFPFHFRKENFWSENTTVLNHHWETKCAAASMLDQNSDHTVWWFGLEEVKLYRTCKSFFFLWNLFCYTLLTLKWCELIMLL